MKKYIITPFLLFSITAILSQSSKSDSILFEAVKSNDYLLVKETINNGANVNTTDNNNWIPLFYSCFYEEGFETAKLLIKKEAM